MSVEEYYDKRLRRTLYRVDFSIMVEENGRKKRKRFRKNRFIKPSDAKNFIAVTLTDALRGELKIKKRVRRAKVVDLVEKFKQIKKDTVSPSSLSRYHCTLDRLAEMAGPNKLISDVDDAMLERYVKAAQTAGRAPVSINNEIGCINECLKAARAIYGDELADWRPPQAKRLPNTKRRYSPMEPDEVARLQAALDTLHPDVARFFAVAVRTAMRPSEILALRWRDILWQCIGTEHGAIRITTTKTKREQRDDVLPMALTVREILLGRKEKLQPESLDEYIFPSLRPSGGRFKPMSGAMVRNIFAKARELAGSNPGRRFYDLRATAENLMILMNVDLETVSGIGRHDPATMLRWYTRTDMRRKVEAINKLEALLPKVSTLPSEDGATSATSAMGEIEEEAV